MTKTSSLDILVKALNDAGWKYEVAQAEVRVPDPDSPNVRRAGWSGRATHIPTKSVPGYVVSASNEVGVPDQFDGTKSLRVHFRESGSLVPQGFSGSYPFNIKDLTLKRALREIATYGPQAIAERKAKQQANEAQREAEEAERVLAAYTEAKEALTVAQHEAFNLLAEDAGLSTAQAEAVMIMIQTGKFGPLLNAATQVERTGKGWLPGSTFVSGTYVDGVRVS